MNTIKTLTLAVIAALVMSASAFAQAPTRGTLSAAVNATQTVIGVSSASGFTAGTTAMVVDREFMLVTSISGTAITVQRGRLSTVANSHASGAIFWVGVRDSGGPFITTELAGSCTATDVTPLILPGTGLLQVCTGSTWRKISVSAPMQVMRPRTAVTATAYTALITDDIIGLTVVSAASTVTLPAATTVPAGKGYLVINETATAATQISITPSSTTINGTTSFTFVGAYNFVNVVSNGLVWFAE